jgi:hypothetical protein
MLLNRENASFNERQKLTREKYEIKDFSLGFYSNPKGV